MVQEQSEVERLRQEVERLRAVLARAGIDADRVAADRTENDAKQGTDLAISRAETAVAREDVQRARQRAQSAEAAHASHTLAAAAALSSSRALVAELRTRDRHQAALIELGDRLRDQYERAAIACVGAEVVGKALRAARAAYGSVDAEAETMMIEGQWCAPGIADVTGLRRFRDYGTFIDDLRRGDIVVVDDVTADPRTRDSVPAFEAIGMRALINVPLVEGGRTIGLAIVQHGGPHLWTIDELAFITTAADRIRAAIAQSEAEARQDVLNGEIAHRLKNTIAMVQAIAIQTLRNPASLAEARKALTDRLLALGKAHDALVAGEKEASTVAKVVEGTLALHSGQAGHIRASGPPVAVGPSSALSLGLMLHELATNAAKYGALSGPAGHVDLTWRVEAEDRRDVFVLTWAEVGGPPVVAPSRRGFGSRLIERGFGGGATVSLAFEPSGVVSILRMALAALASGDATH